MNYTVLINPFERQTDGKLLFGAIVITIIGILAGHALNTRFDGVLDVHFTSAVSAAQAVADSLINIAVLTITLFAAAQMLNRKTRVVDILVTVMIARMPYYFLTLFNINDLMSAATEKMLSSLQEHAIPQINDDLTLIMAFTVISIAALIWFALLLYHGFKVSTNAKGTKCIVLLIVSILLAEIISKLIFIQLIQ